MNGSDMKTLIKRGVYTSDIEEATIPCYMSLVNFGTWPYYYLMVGMVFCFYFSRVILILDFQLSSGEEMELPKGIDSIFLKL